MRNKRILISPDNNITRDFIGYLQSSSSTFSVENHAKTEPFIFTDVRIYASQLLHLEVFGSEVEAVQNCCQNVWGIIDMAQGESLPLVTLRMHPSAVPDTRNFAYVTLQLIHSL